MCWKTIAVIAIVYIALIYLFQNISWGTRWNMTEAFTQSIRKLKKNRVHGATNRIHKKSASGSPHVKESYDNSGDESGSDIDYDSESDSEFAKKELLEHIDQMSANHSPNNYVPAGATARQQIVVNPGNQDLQAQNLHQDGPLPLGSYDGSNALSPGDMNLGNLETFNNAYVSMANHYNGNGGSGHGMSNIVEPVNYYPSDEGISNFESNAYDIKRFFKTNNQQQVERQLQQGNGITNKKNNSAASPQVRKTTLAVPDYHNPPRQWNYENELVMNGAPFVGNVTGYNTDDNAFQYESFNTPTPNSDITNYNYDNLAPRRPKRRADDLRMGMGKPAASIRAST